MLESIVSALGELADEMVFVGGSVASLYREIEVESSSNIRSTFDVDAVVKVSSIVDYYSLEKRIKNRGFVNCTEKGAPICRYKYGELLFDLMPDDESILGFSNKWYSAGIPFAERVLLPSGDGVKILPLPYYVGSKLEAFSSRGNNDYLMSHDLEDVITIMRFLKEPSGIFTGEPELVDYLKSFFRKNIRGTSFIDYLYGEYPGTPQGRDEAKKLVQLLRSL